MAEEGIFIFILAYLPNKSYLWRVELQFRHTLPSIHLMLCAYSCAIEVRLMYVCYPFDNRITIGQQSNNKRTTVGERAKERTDKKGVKVDWNLGAAIENYGGLNDRDFLSLIR